MGDRYIELVQEIRETLRDALRVSSHLAKLVEDLDSQADWDQIWLEDKNSEIESLNSDIRCLSRENLSDEEFDAQIASYQNHMTEIKKSLDGFQRRVQNQRRAAQLVTRAVRHLAVVFQTCDFWTDEN